jgi:hypothetical protein
MSGATSNSSWATNYYQPLVPLMTPTQEWERKLHEQMDNLANRSDMTDAVIEEARGVSLKLEWIRLGHTKTQYDDDSHLPVNDCVRNMDMKTMSCTCHGTAYRLVLDRNLECEKNINYKSMTCKCHGRLFRLVRSGK